MSSFKDIAGQRFGKLVAVQPTEKRYGSSVTWECRCDCGNITSVPSHNLRNGHTKSCGCLTRSKGRDLKNQRFGKLVAIRPTDKRVSGRVVWECQCACGNIVFVTSYALRTGSTKSCGCLRHGMIKDLAGQRFGRLVAVRATEKRCGTSVIWECRCDCGNTTFVASHNLRNGLTKSCGCLRREMNTISARRRKMSLYE